MILKLILVLLFLEVFNVLLMSFIMHHQVKLSSHITFLKEECLLIIQKHKKINTVKIEPQLSLILTTLFEAKNELILKDDLINSVWQGNTFVGCTAIRKNIYKLRSVIKDNNLDDELLIITIPKKGYKLMVLEPALIKKQNRLRITTYAAAAVLLLFLILRFTTEENSDYKRFASDLVQQKSEAKSNFNSHK